MFRFKTYTNLVYLICVAILVLALWERVEAQSHSFESLRNEVAKMASQIPPEDRNRVAVLEPVVDREELQDCIGRHLAEVVIQTLWEFQFALIEKGRLLRKITSDGANLDRNTISQIGIKTGARSIFIGAVGIDHETIRITWRMIRVETMEIIGIVSCVLHRKELTDCFLTYDLTPPTLGALTPLPEPRKLR